MPFTLDRFIALRPFVFHLTAVGNLNRIMEVRSLQPASELMAIGGWNAPRTAARLTAKHDGIHQLQCHSKCLLLGL